MSKVKCDVCKNPLENWSGNVMVLEESMDSDGVIDDVQIWCKPCTRNLDQEGKGKFYHNLWEMSWLKEDRKNLLNESRYAKRFSQRVRDKLLNVIK